MRKEILQSLKTSMWVTHAWLWLIELMSRLAAPILFCSVLYSGYQLVEGTQAVPKNIDITVQLVQLAALDIGGLALMSLAIQRGHAKASFPYRVGQTLVVLMILNMVLSEAVRLGLALSIAAFAGGILLLARAIMCVVYNYALHGLGQNLSESCPEEDRELSESCPEEDRELSESCPEEDRESEHSEILIDTTMDIGKKIALLYAEKPDSSVREVVGALGCARSTVYAYKKKLGV